jgi:hypothetical protein
MLPLGLWIADEPLDVSRHATADTICTAVLNHPHIRAQAAAACALSAPPAWPDLPVQYVCQRECHIAPNDANVLIGSDRATTCHIVLLRSALRVVCAHLDGTPGGVAQLIAEQVNPFSAEVEAFLIGGFADESGASLALTVELLHALHRATVPVHLELVALATLNSTTITRPWRRGTITTPAPILRGLAYLPATQQLWFNPPLPFTGQAWDVRTAYGLAGTSALYYTHEPALPAQLTRWPVELIDEYLALPDVDLLEQLSTSPYVEHASFASELRATLRYLRTLAEACP